MTNILIWVAIGIAVGVGVSLIFRNWVIGIVLGICVAGVLWYIMQ